MTNAMLPVNTAEPLIMHIDLNSCFATIEAQANRLLRGRPVAVAAYDTPRGMVLASNYTAKAKGVKLGVNVQEAQVMCPGIVVMTPDPSKYREAHRRFKHLLQDYSPDVVPKSIDEFVIDFRNTPKLRSGMTMQEIGQEIKERIYKDIGEAVTVNVGIAPNRFLAKYAAGFNKPNGLTQIDHTNLADHYKDMDLIDLPGINVRYRERLKLFGISNPLEFFEADGTFLQKTVFRSVVGYHWHMRLRGFEADKREFQRRSVGHQYALSKKTKDPDELARILLKLCEKVGRRLRRNNLYATGMHLYIGFVRDEFNDGPASFENLPYIPRWSQGHKVDKRLYSTQDVYLAALHLLKKADIPAKVKIMAITAFEVRPWDPEQGNIFEVADMQDWDLEDKREFREYQVNKRLSDALDAINDRYGEYVVTPATMMDMRGTILDRVAFGNSPDVAD